MNKLFSILSRAGVCVAATVLPAMAGNVLSNAGFESDAPGQSQNLAGWTWYGQTWGNTFNETGPEAHTGHNYFKVFPGFTGSLNYSGVYQDYISGPGAVYTAAGWAQTRSSDLLTGDNAAWIEVSFRDADTRVLGLYRSGVINTHLLESGAFPADKWVDLAVTNQYDPNTFTVTNTVSSLVAPPGTYFVRYQIVLEGDVKGSKGSVFFDDLRLNSTGIAPYGDWGMVWSDEFNGPALDTNTWTFDTGDGGDNRGWGNRELEYYTSATNNAYVANGMLHIVARQQPTNGCRYTSARLKSQGLASWQYGRFEWRARTPGGTGFWPALWLLGTNITNVSWPGCGEIDVVENNGTLTQVQGSLHSGSDETAIYTFPDGGSVTNFHIYVLDWSTNALLFYVDGHLYQRQSHWTSNLGDHYPAPFDKPCFMIMNLAVGGNYVGNPSPEAIDGNGGWPGDLQVDYMRVYNLTSPLKISTTGSQRY